VAAHRHHGVVPICRVLSTEEHQIAPSSVRSALARPTCARRLADDELKPKVAQIFADNYEVYGARKIKASLKREHDAIVDRARVTRLMSELEIRGAARSRSVRTTKPDKSSPRVPDLVKRKFCADRPNELWVSDFTYVPTWSGFVYVAFIVDVYSRFVVGSRVSSSMTTDLVMDALEMAVFNRRTRLINDVIAHSDAGSQGGFQWSSQHHDDGGVGDVQARACPGDSGDARQDLVARSAFDVSAGASGSVLGGDRSGQVERGSRQRRGDVASGRVEMVPRGWRDATAEAGRHDRALSVA
jgi:putative transposase